MLARTSNHTLWVIARWGFWLCGCWLLVVTIPGYFETLLTMRTTRNHCDHWWVVIGGAWSLINHLFLELVWIHHDYFQGSVCWSSWAFCWLVCMFVCSSDTDISHHYWYNAPKQTETRCAILFTSHDKPLWNIMKHYDAPYYETLWTSISHDVWLVPPRPTYKVVTAVRCLGSHG